MRPKKSTDTVKDMPKADTDVANANAQQQGKKKSYLQQSDVPSMSATQAAKLAKAIADHYAYKATTPLRLAEALKVQPNSGGFRMLCGASAAYGFTKGSWNSQEISLEPIGLSFVRPLFEGEDVKAFQEAVLKPRVVGEFLRRYHNAALPREDIAKNVLVDMGVPNDRTQEVLALILKSAEDANFTRTINGKKYLDLDSAWTNSSSVESSEEIEKNPPALDPEASEESVVEQGVPAVYDQVAAPLVSQQQNNRKVFITHGKNRSLVDLIKRFLAYAEMEPLVLVEKETVSQPVPEKVMEAMRSCSAAVIHIDADQKLIDGEGKEVVMLNPNVLVEVGAAMALYGRRFILLVRDGVTLPSNLQGLYEVRYSGDTLDGNAVMKLLEALSDLKKRPLPA